MKTVINTIFFVPQECVCGNRLSAKPLCGGHVLAVPPLRRLLARVLGGLEREFFIDNLLVRIQFIIEMILVDRPRAMGV